MSVNFTNLNLTNLNTGLAGCTVLGPTVNEYTPGVYQNITGTGAYGFSKYAGIGFNNNGVYPAYTYYSDDGITWTGTASGVNAEYRICAFGTDRFVAVAGNSATSNRNAVSLDGINWTHYTNLPSSSFWYGLAYGAGKFVAGAYASSVLASSTTGITWSSYSTGLPGVDTIAYGNGIWVSAYRNASTMYRSSDAITWTAVSPALAAGSVTFSNDLFISRVYSTITQFHTSPDGITWTPRSYPASGSWVSPIWNGSVWVLWGIVGGVARFYWSTNLTTWGALSPVTSASASIALIAMGAGKYVLYQPGIGKSYTVAC